MCTDASPFLEKLIDTWDFPSGAVVMNLPANAEDSGDVVWSLGWKHPMEEGMETHSSILAWRIPWTGEPGGLQSIGSQRAGHDRSQLSTNSCDPGYESSFYVFFHLISTIIQWGGLYLVLFLQCWNQVIGRPLIKTQLQNLLFTEFLYVRHCFKDLKGINLYLYLHLYLMKYILH